MYQEVKMPNGGLVQQAQKSQPPTANDAAPGEEDESNLTPEEQEIYDSAMSMVSEIIYANDESHQAIVESLSGDDIAYKVADSTVMLLSKIEETFQGNYPEDLIIITADEISDLLLELGGEAGNYEYTEELSKETKVLLIDLLGEEYGADPADIEEALGDITSDDVSNVNKEFGVGDG